MTALCVLCLQCIVYVLATYVCVNPYLKYTFLLKVNAHEINTTYISRYSVSPHHTLIMRGITSSLTLLLLWGLIHQTAGASESPVTCHGNNTACEVVEENLLDTVGGVLSIEDCRLLCYDNDDCGFITYFGMDSFPLRGICQLFLSCDTVQLCSNCVSETRECYRTCGTNYSGRISENLLDTISDVGQEVDCKFLCQASIECTFYNYFLATDGNSPLLCFLLSGVEEPIEICENCVTGPAYCDGGTTVSSKTTTTEPCICDIGNLKHTISPKIKKYI